MCTDLPGVAEYVTCRPDDLTAAGEAIRIRGIRGSEVFMADLKTRTLPLADDEEERAELLARLRAAKTRRIHASYWAAPTAFVGNVGFGELVGRFAGLEQLREYFGDLTGEHMFSRWRDEYALARDLGADAYVFHLIDYMPVDGAWEFTVDRRVVLDAMIVLVQRFLRVLDDHGLVDEDSPIIELENAGWGLEFGAQTADDFAEVLARVYDRTGRLRIGWDLNHLLHATGTSGGRGAFLLPEAELTPSMREIEEQADGDIEVLSAMWIRRNVLDARLVDRVSAIHLSDCTPKDFEYFRNGVLDEAYAVEGGREAQQEEGLRIVLDHYDNHVPLGDGVLGGSDVRDMLASIAERHELMLLHELKNSSDVWAELDRQRAGLLGSG
ncbi:hypothetical protein JD276_06615 [Leucobacter sp. CSA1]|uniref:Xylose isomerase-like TIM barrel domain-containing protein n=1 Tax=Leucobacter chromiisoli TaxID=2796471 RepID=A0A934Q8C8_9MICO|nr:TIM barrel protein [Leucobacter chromiisoli]MBK0418707.1 hypothetical protein [Leucobacter chromiisoli]